MNQFPQEPLSVLKWTVFTSAGWFAGFALTLLVGLPMEALEIGNQSSIGIGMGAGVGLMQARLLARYQISGMAWFLTSLFGMSVVYILYDVLASKINMGPEGVLPLVTAVGSLLAGVLQYHYVLKPISAKSWSWIIFNCLGWTFAHVLLNVVFLLEAHKQPGLPVVLVVIVAVTTILAGGPVLGYVTGRSMVSALTKKAD